MKTIIILLLLFGVAQTTSVFAQTTSHVDSLINFFQVVATNGSISVPFKGQEYKQDGFLRLIDSILLELSKRPVPNLKSDYFGLAYKTNDQFKKIIDEIDAFKPSAIYYKSSAYKNLLNNIKSISKPNDKLNATFFLRNKLIEDTVNGFREYNELDLPIDYTNATKDEIGLEFSYSGRFYDENQNLPYSLELYYGALTFFRQAKNYKGIGETEEAIAELYFKRNIPPYFKYGIDHYDNALSAYSKYNDPLSVYTVALRLADKQLYNVKEPTLEDILTATYYSGKRSAEQFDYIRDSITSFTSRQNLEINLDLAKHALLYYSEQPIPKRDSIYWGDFLSTLFIFLGDYFSAIADWNTSTTYFSLAVAASLSNWERYKLVSVYNCLGHLARMFAYKGDQTNCLKYLNLISELSSKTNDRYQFCFTRFDKAINEYILHNYAEGLSSATEGALFLKSLSIRDQLTLEPIAFKTILEGYQNLQQTLPIYTDSLNAYYFKYNSIVAGYMSDLDKMIQTEIRAKEGLLNETIDSLDSKLLVINVQLQAKQKELLTTFNKLSDAQTDLRKEISVAKQLHDSMELQKDTISMNSAVIGRLGYTADSLKQVITAEIKKQEELKKNFNLTKEILASIIAFVVLIGIILFVRNRIVNKQRTFNLNLVIKQADASARNLSHNIKSDYSDFLNFIDVEDYEKSKIFAESAGDYLGLATTKFSEDEWTLYSEMEMLYAYADVREKAGLHLEIVSPDNINLDWKKIKFPSDVFTTLLHNFIKNIDPTKSPKFVIIVLKNDNFISCEVTDNGIPSALERYIRDDRPNNGLALLKTRITARCELSKFTRKIKNPFRIDPQPGIGTTIKFVLPYETFENTVS